MSEKPADTTKAAPASLSFWRRWIWQIAASVVILVGVAGYYAARRGQVAGVVVLPPTGKSGPFKLFVYLPRLGSFEAFRQDQAPAREILRKLALPEFPDLSSVDPDGQKQLHTALRMIRAEPKNHDKFGLFGQVCEAQKFLELAVQLYHRAIEMDPDDYEWHYALALRLAKDGEFDQAEAELERASELNPEYAPVWMQRAWRAVERNEMASAVEFAGRYVSLRPDDPFGYVQRAQLHYEQGQWKPMEEDLARARERGPIGKQGHRLLGALYRHLGQLEESRFHLLMSTEDQPGGRMDDPIGIMVRRLETFRNPLSTKFDGLVRAGRYEEALELKDDLLAQYSDQTNYGTICGMISECYRHLADYPNALLYARKACESMPDKPMSHASLALVLARTGQFEAALDEADKALRIDPKYHVALYARGLARIEIAIQEQNLPAELRQADPESLVALAVEDLDKSVHKKPVNYSYLVSLARAHGMLGHYDRADELLTTALRIIPDSREALALKKKAEAQQSFWPEPTGNR